MSKGNKVILGVIGVGRIGRLHAEHLAFRLPEAECRAVADVNAEAAKACAEALNIPHWYDDYRQILADPAIQAVVICSSTDTHAQIIEEAAAAGKHIFCEKPVDHSLEKIDRALNAVAETGVLLQIGFNRRFDPNFAAVKEAITEGRVGDPHILRITSRDPAPPSVDYLKVSGGLFLDMTIHDFDMARFLAGSEVTRVHAVGGVRVNPEIGAIGDIDTAVITLEFENSLIGTIDNSRQAAYGYDQRVEVFGSEGVIATENNTPSRTVWSNRNGVHQPLPLHFFLERYTESYILEMREFVRCVKTGETPSVTGIDGRAPVVIALAAKRSLTEGRPVALSEVETTVAV